VRTVGSRGLGIGRLDLAGVGLGWFASSRAAHG
jgi:hypothetical protein